MAFRHERPSGGKGAGRVGMPTDGDYTTDDLSSDTLGRMPKAVYQQARKHGVRGKNRGNRRDGGYGSGGGGGRGHYGRSGSSSDSAASSSGADTTAPWLKVTYQTMPMPEDVSVVSLGEEVERFGQFMSLTNAERAERNMLKSTLQDLAHRVWPSSNAKVYGSFAYGLSLPSSDIDMVIEDCNPPPVETFPAFVALCAENGFQIVGEISGNFLKVKNGTSNLTSNITFTPSKSPVRSSVSTIKEFLQRYPASSAVIMVVRTVLSQCNLVDVPSGGLSSFAVILMTFYICQNYGEHLGTDAGELLKEFLHVYGEVFDFAQCSVRVNPEGAGYGLIAKVHPSVAISICDPLDANNNVADQCNRLTHIRSMFRYCYMALGKWEPASSEAFRGRTPLSTIIAHNALWSRLSKFQQEQGEAQAPPVRP